MSTPESTFEKLIAWTCVFVLAFVLARLPVTRAAEKHPDHVGCGEVRCEHCGDCSAWAADVCFDDGVVREHHKWPEASR